MSTTTRYFWASLKLILVLTVLLGVAYPATIWAVGQVAFGDSANGSRVSSNGGVVGSSLVGQSFAGPEWFHGRPPAAGDGYDAMASGASNLAPTSGELLGQVQQRRADAATDNTVDPGEVPPDAVTASGSGLDPNISPAYVMLQVNRVAEARGLDPQAVTALVDEFTQGRVLGFLGAPRVNVLGLNLALEQLAS